MSLFKNFEKSFNYEKTRKFIALFLSVVISLHYFAVISFAKTTENEFVDISSGVEETAEEWYVADEQVIGMPEMYVINGHDSDDDTNCVMEGLQAENYGFFYNDVLNSEVNPFCSMCRLRMFEEGIIFNG